MQPLCEKELTTSPSSICSRVDRTCELRRRWRITRRTPCRLWRLEVRLQEPARERDGRFFLLIRSLPSTVHRFRFLAFAPVNWLLPSPSLLSPSDHLYGRKSEKVKPKHCGRQAPYQAKKSAYTLSRRLLEADPRLPHQDMATCEREAPSASPDSLEMERRK